MEGTIIAENRLQKLLNWLTLFLYHLRDTKSVTCISRRGIATKALYFYTRPRLTGYGTLETTVNRLPNYVTVPSLRNSYTTQSADANCLDHHG